MCKAFIAMPFDRDLDGVAQELAKALEEHGFEAKRADDFLNQQNILKDIVIPLSEYDLLIADLTGLNSNVMYELGLAHALDTPVIMITQNRHELPFDLQSYRALEYSPIIGQFDEFRESFSQRLDNIDEITFGSPVSDHLRRPPPQVRCEGAAAQPDHAMEEEEEAQEAPAGYLDHLEEIHEGTEMLAAQFNEITEASEEVTGGITRASEIITRARSEQGRAQIRTARMGAASAAETLRNYASRIGEPRSHVAARWPQVDLALAGLLDWQMEHLGESDRARVLELLDQIDEVRATAASARETIMELRSSVRSSYGFDRGLNYEIDNTTDELDRLIDLLAEIAATFERARQYKDRLLELP